MTNNFKKRLQNILKNNGFTPSKHPVSKISLPKEQTEKAKEQIENAKEHIYDKYLSTYSSQEVQEYFNYFIAAFLIEYSKNYPNYKIATSYRLKSKKSLEDKVNDYVSRIPEKSKVVVENKNNDNPTFGLKMDNIADAFAMKIVLEDRPTIIPSRKGSTIHELLKTSNANKRFADDMQEFEEEIYEASDDLTTSTPIYGTVTKKDYYENCIKLIEKIITTIPTKSNELIEFYQNKIETCKIKLNSLENENTLVGEEDYPSLNESDGKIDFSKLLKDFNERIYDHVEFEITSTQIKTLFDKSDLLKQFGISIASEKEKIRPNGYIAKFYIMKTPIGYFELQVQTKRASKDAQFGHSAHTNMNSTKKLEMYEVPKNSTNYTGLLNYADYVSPNYFSAELDESEKNRVKIIRASLYENYRKVLSEVPKGSEEEKKLEEYIAPLYENEEKIFGSLGQTKQIAIILSEIYDYINKLKENGITVNLKDSSENTQIFKTGNKLGDERTLNFKKSIDIYVYLCYYINVKVIKKLP